MNTLITLHGANMEPSSMQFISKAMGFYLNISKELHLELPGHGTCSLPTHDISTVDDMATEVCRQLQKKGY